MKRAITLLLVLTMAIGLLAGCSKANSDGTTGTTGSTSPVYTEATGTGKDDVTHKGRYTVSDEDAIAGKDVVVASIGDMTITNSQLQAFYWMTVYSFIQNNYYYLSYYNLDPSVSLSMQIYDEKTGSTWEQYFLQEAIYGWRNYAALMLEAQKENYKVPEDFQSQLDGLEEELKEAVKEGKFESVDEMLASDLGAGSSFESYKYYMDVYYISSVFFANKTGTFKVTDAEIEKYFTDNQESLKTNYKVTKDSGNVVDVRHVLITPEGGTTDSSGKTTYTDAAWADCQKKAQELLDQWKAGEATEDSFAALANDKSTDPGSNTNGGLYAGVTKGQMVAAFDSWIFDESRKYGDTDLVKTEFGYHIMYFVKSEPGWVFYSRDGVIGEKAKAYLEGVVESYETKVDYSKITIAEIKLA